MTTGMYQDGSDEAQALIARLEQEGWCREQVRTRVEYRKPVQYTVLLGYGIENTIGANVQNINALYLDMQMAIRQAWRDSADDNEPVTHDQHLHFKTLVDFWQGRYLAGHDKAWRATHDPHFIP